MNTAFMIKHKIKLSVKRNENNSLKGFQNFLLVFPINLKDNK